MKRVTFKLTKSQLAKVESLRDGETGDFGIFGQAFIHPLNKNAGEAEFSYCTSEQHAIIQRAINRAKKLAKEKR